MTERIDVALDERTYPVWIGDGLLAEASRWDALVAGRRVLVVSDTHVAPLYGARLAGSLASALDVASITVPAGETGKTLATCSDIFDALSQLRAGRDSLVVGLGG